MAEPDQESEALVRGWVQRGGEADSEHSSCLRPPSRLPEFGAFIGRERELSLLRQALGDVTQPAWVALRGEPGAGRTHLAVGYAAAHTARYPGGTLLLCCAEDPLLDLALCAEEVPGEELRARALRALSTLSGPTLIILDDAEDEGMLRWLLAHAGAPLHVLITTTRRRWPEGGRTLDVEGLSSADAECLLQSFAADAPRSWAPRLLLLSGGSTLHFKLGALLLDKKLRAGEEVQLEQLSPRALIGGLGRDASRLLHAAALFAPSRIQKEALCQLLGWKAPRLDPALETLLELYLLDPQAESLRLHPSLAELVHGECLTVLGAPRVQRHWEAFCAAARALSDAPHDLKTRRRFSDFPASFKLWQGWLKPDLEGTCDVAYAAIEAGNHAAAQRWFEHAVALLSRAGQDVDHLDLGLNLHQVGVCLSRQQKFEAAAQWFTRAYEQEAFGDEEGRIDHASLAQTAHAVAYCSTRVGQLAQAQAWFERAAQDAQDALDAGAECTLLGVSLHQVGELLKQRAEFAAARAWFERAVSAKQKLASGGAEVRASLAVSVHEIGVCLSRLGEFTEAQTWFERAVREAEAGASGSPGGAALLARSAHEVGTCLRQRHQYEEAVRWFERALSAAMEAKDGAQLDQDCVFSAAYNLGFCLSKLGRLEQARAWFETAVHEARRADVHGRVNHENLGRSLHNVGYCLSRMGRHAAAAAWFEQAIDATSRGEAEGRVEPAHLAESMQELAACLLHDGRSREADAWQKRAAALTS